MPLYHLFTDSGKEFYVGRFLKETSPYLWGSIGLCIGFGILGAGWRIVVTGSSTLGGVDYSTGVLKHSSSPFFPDLRKGLGPYIVDKTKLIENIVVRGHLNGGVDLVLRPRRCGKSSTLQMLKSFFAIPRNNDPEPQALFKGLYITSFRQDICAEHMGKYPVLFIDLKSVAGDSWSDMLSTFGSLVSGLYHKWEGSLMETLAPQDKTYFQSILFKAATIDDLGSSLFNLTRFLASKFGRRVIVLIDEYDSPINYAYGCDYLDTANQFLGRQVFPALLKSNVHLQYSVLVGIRPAYTLGWHSCLNNVNVHALHTRNSAFSTMLMFTEPEVERLKTLSESELDLRDLKRHYSSYLAGGNIGVLNPVSVMSAFGASSIGDFWVATGQFPLMDREFPDNILDVAEDLLAGRDIEFTLTQIINDSITDSSETLTLLYYAGYLTMTTNGTFKIPNSEVMGDWARWRNSRVYAAAPRSQSRLQDSSYHQSQDSQENLSHSPPDAMP